MAEPVSCVKIIFVAGERWGSELDRLKETFHAEFRKFCLPNRQNVLYI